MAADVIPDDMTPGPYSCSADVAAYALGALDQAEADAFAQHLRTCAVCPLELVTFHQVIDDIAISAPSFQAPRELRRRVLGAVEADMRLRSVPRIERRSRRLRLHFNGPAVTFAGGLSFAVAAVLVGVVALPGRPGNRTVPAVVTGGTGSASLAVTAGHGDISLHHVAAPPHGEIYEVWLKRGKSVTPANAPLFAVNGAGNASVKMDGSLSGVSEVLVTPEPAGGTLHPTHRAVVTATLE
jgi:anti-sigma-K factor RskA